MKIDINLNHIDSPISNVYKTLAKSIMKKFGDQADSFVFECNGEETDINEESMCSFLKSQTFYKVQIKKKNSDDYDIVFIKDFLALSSKFKLDNILKNASRSDASKQFNVNHGHKNEFMKLKKYSNTNIRLEDSNKVKILEYLSTDAFDTIEFVKKIFKYEQLTQINRHKLMSKFNVSVCPYCNIGDISSYEFNGKIISSSDLDHFLPKSLFPEYALCLYNFIPSCTHCNSRIKGSKSLSMDSHVYPHEDNFGEDGVFMVDNIYDVIEGIENSIISMKVMDRGKKENINASKDFFRITERYQSYREEADELINKSIQYNEVYEEYLKVICSGIDLKKMVFGVELSETEMVNVSKSKFKNNILKQLGVF